MSRERKKRIRGVAISRPGGVLAGQLRYIIHGDLDRAALTIGINPQSLMRFELAREVDRETRHKIVDGLGRVVDLNELSSDKPPTHNECLERRPTVVDVDRMVEEFLTTSHRYHELASLICVHPARVKRLEYAILKNLADRYFSRARLYNESGAYLDSYEGFAAAARLYGLCARPADELTCLIQCFIVAWTVKAPQVSADIVLAFDRANALLADPHVGPSQAAHALSGLACGTFHYFTPVTEGLLALAAKLFEFPEYEGDRAALVDPPLATRRRIVHSHGDQDCDSAWDELGEIATEFDRRGSAQGAGNTLFAAMCLREEQARRSDNLEALDEVIDLIEEHVNTLERASAWCREFSGFGRGRMLLERGKTEEGEALIAVHLPRIIDLGFAPGRPMALRYPHFFSPIPRSDREAKLFGLARPIQIKDAFPISDKKLGKLMATVKNRFGIP